MHECIKNIVVVLLSGVCCGVVWFGLWCNACACALHYRNRDCNAIAVYTFYYVCTQYANYTPLYGERKCVCVCAYGLGDSMFYSLVNR